MIASKLRFSQNRPVRNAKCPVRNAISPEWLTLWRKNFKPICYPLRAPSRINNIFVWIIWAIPVGQTMFMSIFSLLYLYPFLSVRDFPNQHKCNPMNYKAKGKIVLKIERDSLLFIIWPEIPGTWWYFLLFLGS